MADWHLLVHNVGSIISIIAIFGLAVFVVLNNPRSRSATAFTLMLVSVIVFVAAHVIGVNIIDPELSRDVLMFNLSIMFIGIFILHSILIVVNKEQERRIVLMAVYAGGISLAIIFILYPNLFLLPSVPKMYFPNYYNPGIFNWIRVVFLYVICLPYGIYELIRAYRATTDNAARQQLKFFIIAIIVGFAFGFIPNFLVYNIYIDPLIGMIIFSLFTVPVLYGAVRYEFLNVKIIARQALFYSLAVVIVGGFITLLNNVNVYLASSLPGFPSWLIPLISSILAVTIGVVVWRKLRQGDLLKYEFITTVTHKFRTPLTHIKWASENLATAALPAEERTQIEYIQSANTKLVELTSLLMNVSETEGHDYEYHLQKLDLAATVEEVIAFLGTQLKTKNVNLVKNISTGCFATYDASRIHFIAQTFIENAIHYTAANSEITVTVVREGKDIRCSVKDNGIGIPKDEIPLLFAKFYRGHQARLTDTEGMGIGLFMSKEIIIRHNGRIWVESEGLGKGSTFNFTIPASN